LTTWYLDTSAALKLIVEETESESLARTITRQQPGLVACCLLETELRRAAARHPELSQSMVLTLLDSVTLYDVPSSLFREAGLLPGTSLRSLDAIHLAAALRLGADALVTYDVRMLEAAHELGLHTLAPGT